jgi:hypothetical protein
LFQFSLRSRCTARLAGLRTLIRVTRCLRVAYAYLAGERPMSITVELLIKTLDET